MQEYTVKISALELEAIIGILDFERLNPQKLLVNISFSYQDKTNYINYAEVASFVKTQLIEKKYLLLEDALDDISQQLYKNFPSMKNLSLEIEKPTILSDCSVSVALHS